MKTFKTRLKIYAIAFVIANLFFATVTFGQTTLINDKVDFSQSKTSVSVEEFKEGKYSVRIITVGSSGYGYEILDKNKVIVRQNFRPYFLIPTLFLKIDNAKIVAKSHVLQINENGKNRMVMDIERAMKLGVSKEDLTVSTDNKH